MHSIPSTVDIVEVESLVLTNVKSPKIVAKTSGKKTAKKKKLPVKPRLDEAKDSESGSGGTADHALWDALDRNDEDQNDEDQNDEDDAIQSNPEVVSNEGGALLLSPAVAPGDNREFRRLRRGAPRNYDREGDHEMTIVTSKSDAEELAIDGM